MAGLRRAPKPVIKPRPKRPVKAPLHHRILGRNQVELDLLDDLYDELERVHDHFNIADDQYLECLEALDIRKAKALEGLEKAKGRYHKPHKPVKAKRLQARQKPLRPWQMKVIQVVAALIVIKVFLFRG